MFGKFICQVSILVLVAIKSIDGKKPLPMTFTLVSTEPSVTVRLGENPNGPGYIGTVEEVKEAQPVAAFKGIQYAKTPVGELRYKVLNPDMLSTLTQFMSIKTKFSLTEILILKASSTVCGNSITKRYRV